jgi:hypothetical protein
VIDHRGAHFGRRPVDGFDFNPLLEEKLLRAQSRADLRRIRWRKASGNKILQDVPYRNGESSLSGSQRRTNEFCTCHSAHLIALRDS